MKSLWFNRAVYHQESGGYDSYCMTIKMSGDIYCNTIKIKLYLTFKDQNVSNAEKKLKGKS